MTYLEAEAYLLGLPRFAEVGGPAYRPGLERICALLEAMGRPQDAWNSIHVAGTNGKGSTASLIASVASTLGFRTGLHTSPHLVRLGERMRVDGVPASEDWLAGAVARYRWILDEVCPSYFEATTALSFLYFADSDVETAVVEVGMGGRLDATNVLQPLACAITHIGYDHVEFLGSTLGAIAREKAGIIKRSTPVVLAPSPAEVVRAVAEVSERVEAPLHLIEEEVEVWNAGVNLEGCTFSASTPLGRYEHLRIGAGGGHQIENATTALRVAELAWPDAPGLREAVYSGFGSLVERTGLRGRLEIVGTEPLLIADVAHNADGIGRTVDAIVHHGRRMGNRLFVVLGLMADKDAAGIAFYLSTAGAIAYCVEMGVPRAMAARTLAQKLSRGGVSVSAFGPLNEMLHRARSASGKDDVILVTGSHFLVGELLSAS